MNVSRIIPVPEAVWRPIADAIAAEHGVTTLNLLYGDRHREEFIPRAKFWRALRAHPGKYSYTAIADITGHDHTSVIYGIRSPTADLDFKAVRAAASLRDALRFRRREIANLAGQRFGMLVVIQRNGSAGRQGRLWLCECDCGGKRNVTTRDLRLGAKHHCGRHRVKGPVGRPGTQAADVVALQGSLA